MKDNNPLASITVQKQKQFGSLRIAGTIDSRSFSLIFITYDCLNRPDIISLLSKWRKTHEYWFQAQFPISDDRTRQWLKTRVLDVSDRALFLIEVNDRYIGHVGLFRYDAKNQCIDIDNIVRGEEGYKGIMYASLQLLMEWARKELGIKGFTLQTTSDNKKALALYARLGFTQTKRTPLVYTKTEEGGEWREAGDDTKGTIKRWAVFMKKII